jgi:UDP-3-O-[3-hydroxymyristoyl] glucosamine N-acyltransferase
MKRSITVAQMCEQVGTRLIIGTIGQTDRSLQGVATLERAGPDQLSFLANPRYRSLLPQAQAGCVVISLQDRDLVALRDDVTYLLSAQPYVVFARVAQLFAPRPEAVPGVAASASIHPHARLAGSASIGPGAVIEEGACIEEGVVVGAQSFVGARSTVGAGSWLAARVTIYPDCEIGQRAILHSGCVIGADGFGFANDRGTWVKIPQTGRVLIGDDCEIGANTTIDRGAMDDTVVGNDVKLDNQVQIGHNVVIGDHCAFAGCVGIAGSARIGQRVQLGGGAIVLGHLQVCDNVIVSAATTITRSIAKPGFYTGLFPFDENARWEKSAVLVRKLDKMRDQLKAMQSEIAALQQKSPSDS